MRGLLEPEARIGEAREERCLTRVDQQRRFYDVTHKGPDRRPILVEVDAFVWPCSDRLRTIGEIKGGSLGSTGLAAMLGVSRELLERAAGTQRPSLERMCGRVIELVWSELVKACPTCGRWNYHLTGCPAGALERAALRRIGVLR